MKVFGSSYVRSNEIDEYGGVVIIASIPLLSITATRSSGVFGGEPLPMSAKWV